MNDFGSLRSPHPVRLAAVLLVVCGLLAGLASPVRAAGGVIGSILGRVVVQSTQKAVASAAVTASSPSARYTAKTDANGRFTIIGVNADTYTISVESPGYDAAVVSGVTVNGDAQVDLGNVAVAQRLQRIGGTTARAQGSAFQPQQTVESYTVSGQKLETALGKKVSTDQTALLQSVPGFSVDSQGNLSIRGSTTDAVHYQFEGIDFTDPAFGTSINNNRLNGIASVQVVPGAGDPTQGNSGAGVVNYVVQRGTYPAHGVLDLESQSGVLNNQLGFQYGFATPNRRFSNFTSIVVQRFGAGGVGSTLGGTGIGPANTNLFNLGFGSTSYAQGGAYRNGFNNDILNNFIYTFGKNDGQSLQFLYQNTAQGEYGNPLGASNCFQSCDAIDLGTATSVTGLTAAQTQSVFGLQTGQTYATQNVPNDFYLNHGYSQAGAFIYRNALSTDTFLVARFFRQLHWSEFNGTPATSSFASVLGGEQTTGGQRTGANFELTHQFGSKHTVTLAGSYELNHPTFSSYSPLVGLENLGPNAQDFLRPPNTALPVQNDPNAPGYNPCGVVNAATDTPVASGCYIYSYNYTNHVFPNGIPLAPSLNLEYKYPQQLFGYGLRDQFAVSQKLRLDYGFRVDGVNQRFPNLAEQDERTTPTPGNPGLPYIADFKAIDQPRFFEPRFAFAYQFDPRNAFRFSFGNSVIVNPAGEFASPNSLTAFQAGFNRIPVNPNATPYINGITGAPPAQTGPGFTCQPNVSFGNKLGRPCNSYADFLFTIQDAYFPEISAAKVGTYNNFDASYTHQFRNGTGLRFSPYARRGYNTTAITAPLIFNAQTQQFQPGSLTNTSLGRNVTTGAELELTTPERAVGLSGFLVATYTNEFTNTPPASDNPYGQDQEPIILPQSLATGSLYRAGFVSPFVARLGLNYRTRSGFRINPVIQYDRGYPYGVGLLTPAFVNGVAQIVPQTNFTDQYGVVGATRYVDPANPGTVYAPNIAATRGTPEVNSGGGLLTAPRVFTNITLEYTPPKSRNTIGMLVSNVFNNYYAEPQVSADYLPVTTGVAGALTGQNGNAANFPQYFPIVPDRSIRPFSPYTIFPTGAPRTFRFYYQLSL